MLRGVRPAVVTCPLSPVRTTAPLKLRYWGRISIYGNDDGGGGGRPEINQLHTHPSASPHPPLLFHAPFHTSISRLLSCRCFVAFLS